MATLLHVLFLFIAPAVVSSQSDFFTLESTVGELFESSTFTNLIATSRVAVNPTPTQLFQGLTSSIQLAPSRIPISTPAVEIPESASTLNIIAANLSETFAGDGDCWCDLMVERCDIYCCCDTDCSQIDLGGFQCSSISVPNQVCLPSDAILHSSLPPCSCPSPGLFCVQTDLNPSRLQYNSPEFVQDLDEFSTQLLQHVEPGDQPLRQLQQEAYTTFYQAGDPVLVLHSTGILGVFSLPSPLNGLQCHDGNPVAYLQDATYTCERSVAPLATTCTSALTLNALSAFQTFRILQNPGDYSSLDVGSLNTVSVSVRRMNCRDTTGQQIMCSNSVGPTSPAYDSPLCSNVLLEASYNVIHNGTGEILGASVDLTLGSVGSQQASIVQTFKVRFVTAEQVEDVMLQRSGKPGYLDGERLLAGILTDIDQINISVDSSKWLLVSSSSTDCRMRSTEVSLRFREDISTVCTLHIPVQDLLSDCRGVRQMTQNVLLPSSPRSHVGIYGNSNPLDLLQWVPILNNSAPVPQNQEATGSVCQDIITSVHIHILYAYSGQFENPIAVITGVQYTYGTEDIAALFRSHYTLSGSPSVPVPLQTIVVFTDVSAGPTQLLFSTSDIVRQLPHDFLYPFFVSNSDICSSDYCILWTLLLLIQVYYEIFM